VLVSATCLHEVALAGLEIVCSLLCRLGGNIRICNLSVGNCICWSDDNVSSTVFVRGA
jgi:ankyrin repeat protein